MKALWIALFLATGLAAAAEPAPPPDGTAHAIGGHNCLDRYPAELQTARVEGTTALSFRITKEGRVTEPRVTTSSGNTTLDAAAVACVQNWQYNPAIQNGQPVDVDWSVTVNWAASTPTPVVDPKSIGPQHICLRYYPIFSIRNRESGTATVVFTITAEGRTADIRVMATSGFSALDAAAVRCASDWLYQPATQGGVPVAVPWHADIRFWVP
jgi:TonB family protein